MDAAQLEAMGLNHNEALVYITLLKLGESGAKDIISRTRFHRNIVYDNLEKLLEKGLVSYILVGRRKVFQVNPPEMLSAFLDRQQKELDLRKKTAALLKTEINRYQASPISKQQASIMRGVKGVKIVMQEILDRKAEYVSFAAPRVSNDIMTETYWKSFAQKQKYLKFHSKLLFNWSLREWGRQVSHRYNEVRFLKREM